MKKLLPLMGIHFLIPVVVFAQTLPSLPEIVPNSPQASALIESITRPSANYFHGKVDISIPLFTIEAAGVTIPVYLSYDHKGYKANNFTEWLGQGWTLYSEPMVTVSVNGKPDSTHELVSPDDTRHDRNSGIYRSQLANASRYDEYPDTYFYHLPGKNGSFAFAWDRQTDVWNAKVTPFEPIQIVKSTDGTYFEITDDDGTYYRFGKSRTTGANAYEYNQNPTYNYCWKATEIISADKKETITFTYDYQKERRGRVSHFLTIEDPLNPDASLTNWGDGNTNFIPECGWSTPVVKETIRSGSRQNAYVYYTSAGQYQLRWLTDNSGCGTSGANTLFDQFTLINKKITYKNGEVEFIKSGNQLQKIVVKDLNGTVIRTVTFSNRMVESSFPMLTEVKITGKNNEVIGNYSFSYDGNPIISNNLSAQFNFWGYSLGMYGTSHTIPSTNLLIYHRNGHQNNVITSSSFSVGEASSREMPASTKGLLTSITNALGGKTEFEYEPDTYVKRYKLNYYDPSEMTYRMDKKQSGGNRIKKIKETDPYTNTVKVTTIKYGDFIQRWQGTGYGSTLNEENGCGIIKWQITPDAYTYTQTIDMWKSATGNTKRSRLRTMTTNLIAPNSHSGMPICYPIVTEYIDYIQDGTTVSSYKTVFNYQGFNEAATFKFGQSNIPYDYHNDWRFGQITMKEEYEKIGNNYTLKKRTNYSYKTDISQIPTGHSFQHTLYTRVGNPGNEQTLNNQPSTYNYYKHYMEVGALKLRSQTETHYTDGGEVVSMVEYEYDPNTYYPIVEKVTASDGSVRTTESKYVKNMTTAPYTTMAGRNIISPLIQQVAKKDNVEHTVARTNYATGLSANANAILPASMSYGPGSSSAADIIRFHKYDDYGNVLHVSKDGLQNIVYLWSYNHTYPVMEIKNATYAQVTAALGSTSATLLANLSANKNPTLATINAIANPIKTAIPESLVTVLLYDHPFGVKQIVDPSGRSMFYEYDNTGKLLRIKDVNGKTIEQYNYNLSNR